MRFTRKLNASVVVLTAAGLAIVATAFISYAPGVSPAAHNPLGTARPVAMAVPSVAGPGSTSTDDSSWGG